MTDGAATGLRGGLNLGKINWFEFLAATAIGFVTNFLGDHPVNYLTHVTAWKDAPIKRPDLQALVWGKASGKISEDTYYAVMSDYGYDKDVADTEYNAIRQKPTPTEVIRYGFKEGLKSEEIAAQLRVLGFDSESAKKLVTTYEYLPSVSDLLTFSVRDVYTPDTIKKYGMDKEFPEPFVKDASKQGMSEETAKKYWVAHWTLPSIGSTYEMLHRLSSDRPDERFKQYEDMGLKKENLVTDVDTVKDLIRRQDIEPYWRDRLVALSYTPITRIDVRRMYNYGVFDEKDVYWAYRDLGYTDENAKKLTEFVKAQKTGGEKDLSMGYVKEAYALQLIDDKKVKEYLKNVGYQKDEADLIVKIWDFANTMSLVKEKIQTIHNMFKAGHITAEEAQAELDKLNIPSSMRDYIYSKMIRELSSSVKKPTKEDVHLFLKTGQISEDDAVKMLVWIGYENSLAQMFVNAWTGVKSS